MDHRAAPAARRRTHRRWSLVAGSVVPLALVAALAPAALARTSTVAGAPAAMTAAATTATAADGNPLAGRRWGVYKGKTDQAWAPYANATGDEKTLLGKIALRPRSTWFGAWTANSDIRAKVDKYIANMSGGNPEVLVQMAVFRMKPWEHKACDRLPTTGRADQLQAVDRPVRRGRRRAAHCDHPAAGRAVRALRAGRLKVPSHLIGYAARTLLRTAAHQRLHRRGGDRLAQRRPGEGGRTS